MSLTLSRLFEQSHADALAAGWHNGDRDVPTLFCLVHSEISEAMEGARKDLMDEHLPHRKMFEVELADVLIRVGDLSGLLKLDVVDEIRWRYNVTADMSVNGVADTVRKWYAKRDTHFQCDSSIGSQLLTLHRWCTQSYVQWADQNDDGIITYLGSLVGRALEMGAMGAWDLEGAVEEKLAYNRQRADHKAENRKKRGGKKW